MAKSVSNFNLKCPKGPTAKTLKCKFDQLEDRIGKFILQWLNIKNMTIMAWLAKIFRTNQKQGFYLDRVTWYEFKIYFENAVQVHVGQLFLILSHCLIQSRWNLCLQFCKSWIFCSELVPEVPSSIRQIEQVSPLNFSSSVIGRPISGSIFINFGSIYLSKGLKKYWPIRIQHWNVSTNQKQVFTCVIKVHIG